MVQPIYYSFVTITTLGYGDIYPISWPVQLTVIAQLLIGLLIIVIIFQRVLSMQKEPNLQHLKQHFPPNQKTEGEVSNQYDIFYTKFLDRFRHGEDFLRQCFQRYIEIFRNQNPVLDLCCGRGEFLGVMQSSGIEAYGIENNQFLFEKCTKKGLNVKNKDWKEHLHSLEDGSLGGLFSSQFIEHLQYQDLLWLVDVASRKLKPGGVLVLETLCPNLNTILGKFFVDFSHKSPINPEALSFLVANYGFKSTEILYYNYPEPQNMLQKLIGEFADGDMAVVINDNFQKIQKLLFGPHYFAVIGRK
jgi:O-antigen chain-terminating methyltransferase